jgi:hypothetical protein
MSLARKSVFFALAALVAVLPLGACGDDDPPPSGKNACDKLKTCGISSSGVSCDTEKLTTCSSCILDRTCGEIGEGRCDSACPDAKLH